MDDPWKCIDQEISLKPTLNSGSESFEDNFASVSSTDISNTSTNISTGKSRPFEPLPDSSSYLATLEKKLSKLTTRQTVHSSAERRDFLASLSGAREGHIERLLTSNFREVSFDGSDEPLEETLSGTVVRHIAPHLQAVSTVELIHLLKADHLENTYSTEDTEENNIQKEQDINKDK